MQTIDTTDARAEIKRLLAKDAYFSTVTCYKDADGHVLVYHFLDGGDAVDVRTRIGAETGTVTDLLPSASFYEREAWEQFGVVFKGHPKLEKLFHK